MKAQYHTERSFAVDASEGPNGKPLFRLNVRTYQVDPDTGATRETGSKTEIELDGILPHQARFIADRIYRILLNRGEELENAHQSPGKDAP